ncbi:hypothetical protein GGU10DRAFT_381053 [Lentinula aff. detonsa]|uniref:Uncharacterized protein n=1 Tax=Lentinula aff. detonsa TaxID=2804958 RepID=A0AA38NIQ0_9AGAR|nr:hypothetical protein GGU10DRAFT_381053 [Lentinula aff. detonsa]
MAFYLTWALAAPNPTQSYPTGTLALATTAVFMFFLTSTGFQIPNSTTPAAKKKKPANSPDNFSNKWAFNAMRFFNLIQCLKGNKWELIFHASKSYILNIPNAGAGPYLKVAQQEAEKANAQHGMVMNVSQFELAEAGGNDDIILSD